MDLKFINLNTLMNLLLTEVIEPIKLTDKNKNINISKEYLRYSYKF